MNIKTQKPVTDFFEKAPEPKADAGRILETMGQVNPQSQFQAQLKQIPEEREKLERLKAADKAKSQELLAKLEAEIAKWRQVREEQLEQRRQVDEQAQAQVKSTQAQESPLAQPAPKKKRGMLSGIGSRRLKTAQDQAAPELSGKRTGG